MLNLQKINEIINAFSELSKGEFNLELLEMINDQDEQLTMKRIGRLMAVSIKQPFASPFPYDPKLPWNWAKSNRAWEILGPIPSNLQQKYSTEYNFLSQVVEEWEIPEYKIAEWHVFNTICKRLKPIICSDSKVLNRTNTIAKELRESGLNVSILSMNNIINTVSVSIATWLSTELGFPNNLLPIVTGSTLLLCCYGQEKLCKFLTEFIEYQENNPNPFKEYPKCGSTETYNNEPCDNEVTKAGDFCWKHKSK